MQQSSCDANRYIFLGSLTRLRAGVAAMLLAGAMVTAAGAAELAVPSPRGRALALGLGAVAVLVSGAQEAVLAWLVVAIGMRFVGRRGTRGTAIA